MKQWLMIQSYVALNRTFKKYSEKQHTFRSPSGKEKQLDHVVIDRITDDTAVTRSQTT